MNLQIEVSRASLTIALLKQKGQQEGSLQMLITLIESRFGQVPKSLHLILVPLSSEELRELGKYLLQAKSLDHFVAFLLQTFYKDC